MLEDVRVSIDLKDFDTLRKGMDEAIAIKSLIGFITESKIIEDNDCNESLILNVNLEAIEPLIRKYHSFGKPNDSLINDEFEPEEIKIIFKTSEIKKVLKYEKENGTAICPKCGILVDMDRDNFCYKCGQKLEL